MKRECVLRLHSVDTLYGLVFSHVENTFKALLLEVMHFLQCRVLLIWEILSLSLSLPPLPNSLWNHFNCTPWILCWTENTAFNIYIKSWFHKDQVFIFLFFSFPLVLGSHRQYFKSGALDSAASLAGLVGLQLYPKVSRSHDSVVCNFKPPYLVATGKFYIKWWAFFNWNSTTTILGNYWCCYIFDLNVFLCDGHVKNGDCVNQFSPWARLHCKFW